MPGLINRLLGRAASEERATQSWYGAGLAVSAGGTPITPIAAENLAGVTACVNAIASGLATLPAIVYRAQGDGRIEAPNHPVSRLVRAPNRHQTWPDFMEFTISQALLWGNALAVIESDAAGRPTALVPVPWRNVLVSLLPSGRMAYDVVAFNQPWGGTAPTQRFLEDQVLHLRDRTDDGFVGRSRISRAPDVLAAAIGVQTYSSSVWDNSATLSGLLEAPPNISPKGAANARRVLFGDPGTKFTPISVSPEDSEVLASRQFSVVELCRLFNVPPPLIQDYSNNTFTNAATASVWFAVNTLQPWARKIEAEFARSVFADPAGAFQLEIDLSGLVRGDFATRWTANVAAVTAGILTRDEVRSQEGYGPLPAEAKQEPPPAATPPENDPPADNDEPEGAAT
jgi:HK97 family phage portal protein